MAILPGGNLPGSLLIVLVVSDELFFCDEMCRWRRTGRNLSNCTMAVGRKESGTFVKVAA